MIVCRHEANECLFLLVAAAGAMFRALDFLARVLAMKVGVVFGARSSFGKAAEAYKVCEHQTDCNGALHEQIYLPLFCSDSIRSSET
jgi:hypothetical protein